MGRLLIYVGVLLVGFCAEHAESRLGDGHCPQGFETYYDHLHVTCTGKNQCIAHGDCGSGELCCVEKTYDSWSDYDHDRVPSPVTRCPVCKRADLGCYNEDMGRYFKNREMYSPTWSIGCSICQCVDGDYNCMYTCDTPYAARKWAVPLICAGLAVLTSVIIMLSMCCCFKCYVDHKIRKLKLSQPTSVQEEGPAQLYHLISPVEDKVPLTTNEQNTA